MQAEWEEMARRNWISEGQEAQGQATVSINEKVINDGWGWEGGCDRPMDFLGATVKPELQCCPLR